MAAHPSDIKSVDEQGKSLSQVIRIYQEPRSTSILNSLVGFGFMIYSLSEMLGPTIGWPTVSGRIFSTSHLHGQDLSAGRTFLLLLPQLFVIAITGWFLVRSSLDLIDGISHATMHTAKVLMSISASCSQNETVLKTLVRNALLGLLAGFVVTFFISKQFGDLPEGRWSLASGEFFLLALCFVVVLVSLRFRAPPHFRITLKDDQVCRRIPQAFRPAEISLDENVFGKSLILKPSWAGQYEVAHPDRPIRLDRRELILLNFGVLETVLPSGTVETHATNVFQCKAKFQLSVSRSNGGRARLDEGGVWYLINNLYTKRAEDLVTILEHYLSLAMDEYAGDAISAVKTMKERYTLDSTKRTSFSSGEHLRESSTVPTRSADSLTSLAEYEHFRQQTEGTLRELESFALRWDEVRRKQEKAKTDLPPIFEKSLRTGLKSEAPFTSTSTRTGGAQNAVDQLLNWAQIHLVDVNLTFEDSASESDVLMKKEAEDLRQELKAIERRIFDEKQRHSDEKRADKREDSKRLKESLETIIKQFPPLLLSSPRAQQGLGMLFAELEKQIGQPRVEANPRDAGTQDRLRIGADTEEPM